MKMRNHEISMKDFEFYKIETKIASTSVCSSGIKQIKCIFTPKDNSVIYEVKIGQGECSIQEVETLEQAIQLYNEIF